MKRPVFYPPCQHLDPNNRNAAGHFYCERRRRFVHPDQTVYAKVKYSGLKIVGRYDFDKTRRAPDCWHRRGTTRRATF